MEVKPSHKKLAWAALVLLCLLLTSLTVRPIVDSWTASLWVIDYPNEFIKRGLIGEALWRFNSPLALSIAQIDNIARVVLYALVGVFTTLAIAVYKSKPLLLSCLLLASFSLQQWVYDLGRFDQINYLLLFAGLVAIFYCRLRVLSFLFITLITVLMLLIHEASALLQVPLLVSAMLMKTYAQGHSYKLPVAYFVIAIGVFFLVIFFGGLQLQEYHHWRNFMEQKPLDFVLHDNAMQVLNGGIVDNIRSTLERLLSEKTGSRFLRLIILSVPAIILSAAIFKQIWADSPVFGVLLVLPVIAVLPLFILGIDFYRWYACLLVNFFVISGFYFFLKPLQLQQLSLNKICLWSFIIISIYTGPFGISVAMPDRLMIIESLKL